MKYKNLIITAVMAAACSLTAVTASAHSVDAGYSPLTEKISIRGDAGKYNAGNNITMLLLEKDADVKTYTYENIGYVEQGKILSDGTYSFNFSFEGKVSDYKLLMNLAGDNVTDTVTEATAKADMFDVKLNINEETTMAQITGEINNRYGISGQDYQLILAFYDKDNRLLGVNSDKVGILNDEGATEVSTEKTAVPAGTVFTKAFLWESTAKMIPLANEEVLGDERIVCWGDSLTAGAGGNGTTYESVLSSLSGKEVINKGIGGQTATQIAARQGGVKILASEAFTVPATTEPVEIKVEASTGTKIGNRWNNINLDMNCSIDGIDGRLYSSGTKSGTYYEYTWYFQRETPGKPYEVAANTPFISDDSLTLNDNAIAVIWVGTNEGWTSDSVPNDYTTYVSYKAICDGMIEQLKVKDYIIVGLTAGKEADYANMKSILEEKYGDRYLDMRSAITSSSEEEFAKYGITLTDNDKTLMAVGSMPQSMRVDGVHFNANGYTMIGNIMYNHMVKIGILPEK
jgi:hypothetical protein